VNPAQELTNKEIHYGDQLLRIVSTLALFPTFQSQVWRTLISHIVSEKPSPYEAPYSQKFFYYSPAIHSTVQLLNHSRKHVSIVLLAKTALNKFPLLFQSLSISEFHMVLSECMFKWKQVPVSEYFSYATMLELMNASF